VPKSTWFRLPDGKRARVLDAAMAEFGRQGFSSGSLNVISREAAVSKGSLFQYFEDKLDLFAYVCDCASTRVRDAMVDSMEDKAAGLPLFAQLRLLLGDWVTYFAEHPLERGVTMATAFEMDPEVRRTVRAVVNRHYDEVLRPMVKLAADTGELRPDVDRDQLLAYLVLLLPHLALAPHTPELDPFLDLYGRTPAQLEDPATGLLAVLERGFSEAPTPTPTEESR
jgi:AcrR family transcriptional regulator